MFFLNRHTVGAQTTSPRAQARGPWGWAGPRCLLSLSLVAGVIAGCAGSAPVGQSQEPEPGIVDLMDPAVPIPPERFLKPEFARIAPGDQIFLKALSYEDLNGAITVAQDGRINVSLLGSVEAAGRTLDELDTELTQAYSSYFRNFDLAVVLLEPAPRHVYVLGQVRNGGGRYPFSPGDRVVHAVALAGGMLDTARENSVMLLRRDPDGVDHVYRFDFAQMTKDVAPKDIFLQPGDVVYVPKSRFRTFTDFAEEFLDIVQRSAVSALVIDDLMRRGSEGITVGR